MVWLNLIPLFNLVWQFITVIRVAESLKQEFRSRGWSRRGVDYGYGVGIAACALGFGGWIPVIGPLLSLGSLICGIVYWVKIAGFSGRLARGAYYYDDDEDDEDDEDGRPRRRRDEDDEDDDDDRPRRRRRYEDEDDRPRRRRD
ncbi:hypothetical protein [Frigoriglobus tundricola]|nr:hypothetical protein [Frigoriglobus tundricola]